MVSYGYASSIVTSVTSGMYYTNSSSDTSGITGWVDSGTNTTFQRYNASYRVDSSLWATSTTASTTSMVLDYDTFYTLDSPYVNYVQRGWKIYGGDGYALPIKTPAQRLKELLAERIAPQVLSRGRPLSPATDVREMRARDTLRRVLGENKFKDFVRRGAVSVRAKSGLMYQIFPGSDFTKVYKDGKLVERLCVVLTGGFPPTDSLIMRYLMILNNEEQFKSYAVKQGVYDDHIPLEQPEQRSLVEIFKELKNVA